MKSNLAVPCLLLLLLALGCTSWAPPGDDLRTPVPPAEKRRESPRPFYFGGIYRISGCERFGAASGLAAPTPNGALSFADGGIKITVKATPFGMKLQIENKLYESLVLDGTRCTLIDAKGTSHAVELRPPSLLWPEREMMTQTTIIAPRSSCEICFDAIAARHRPRINETTQTDQERGAFVVDDTLLPVFCSGYFLFPRDQSRVDRVRQWAFGRVFGIYLELRGNDTTYGYRLNVTPYRFASGPERDDEAWENPTLTPVAGATADPPH